MTGEPMSDSTDKLIDSIAGGLAPVRRLRPPMLRALGAVVVAAIVIALLTMWRGFRADMPERMEDPGYWVQVIGAALTGIAGTIAAFQLSLPDRSRAWAALPMVPVALWLTGFAGGCLMHWIAIPSDAPVMEDSKRCL